MAERELMVTKRLPSHELIDAVSNNDAVKGAEIINTRVSRRELRVTDLSSKTERLKGVGLLWPRLDLR
jgi:hypothetical protein